LIQKTGSGTLFWSGPSIPAALGNSTINSPITIAAGTVVLQNNTVLSPSGVGNTGSQEIDDNGDLFEYDAPSLAQTLTGIITGGAALQVNNGTLTLSGANTYSGNTIISGGELVVNGIETSGTSGPLGEGGIISFTGGTLGFSVNNTFDYSPRFDTSDGQIYKFDTGGQSVLLTNVLASNGATLTKAGSGTLTLSGANSYSGLTAVSAGKLVFGGSKTGSGNISVADGTALGVTATGTQVTPGTLTVGTSSGATLEFNSVNSTTTALIAAGTLSSAGTVTININSGTFAVGQSYPLLTWTSGSTPAVSLGTLNGFIGNLSFTGNMLKLNITGTAYSWTGANNGSWDISTANNWKQNGSPATFVNGVPALFDDTATGATNVTISGVVQPASVTVNNNSLIYSIASSSGNDIGGSTTLTKSGTGTLTLSGGANAYTGGTTISGGLLSVGALANGGSASDIGASANSAANLVLNGGTLQYTGGGASSDHLFALGTGGGTIDASGSGALNLNNAGLVGFSGTGARVFSLTGTNTATLAASLADNGGATSLTKSSAGTWILTGTNTQSGLTAIAGGTLQIGAGGASGSIGTGNITDNGSLDFNRSGILTVSGVIGGTGSVTNDGSGTLILPGNNSYSGGTTINAGTLQVGNGGATGTLNAGGPIIDDGTFSFNGTGLFSISAGGVISGTGNVIASGSGGLLKAIGANTYTGWTLINPGATFQPCEGNQGALASSVVTNNGTLKFVRQDSGIFIYSGNIVGAGSVLKDVNNAEGGDVTLTGNNTYTNGTIIAGGGIILGDGATPGAGSIVGNVIFTNSAVSDDNKFFEIDRPDNVILTNLISGIGSTVGANQGQFIQAGPGMVTLTANNTFVGSTIISNGVLQVGIGGTTGAIGSTNTITDGGTLIFNRSDNVTVLGGINGSGLVAQAGSGTLTLAGNLAMTSTVLVTNGDSSITTNIFTGSITVSNGTLVVNSPGGIVGNFLSVNGGTLVAGGVGTVKTLIVSNDMNISSGTVVAALNKSLSPSNTTFVVAGAINRTGGSLQLVNSGPALAVGDKFIIFNKAVAGGAGMPIVATGFTVNNNLGLDGSVTVATVASVTPPQITNSVSGGNFNLTWPSGTGLSLQVQTNSLSVGLSTNWVTIPGTATVNTYSAPVNTASNTCVFYRLAP
jgi:autotransporter-associated beta strand protein